MQNLCGQKRVLKTNIKIIIKMRIIIIIILIISCGDLPALFHRISQRLPALFEQLYKTVSKLAENLFSKRDSICV